MFLLTTNKEGVSDKNLVIAATNLENFICPLINAAIVTTICPTELVLVCLSLIWYKHS